MTEKTKPKDIVVILLIFAVAVISILTALSNIGIINQ